MFSCLHALLKYQTLTFLPSATVVAERQCLHIGHKVSASESGGGGVCTPPQADTPPCFEDVKSRKSVNITAISLSA